MGKLIVIEGTDGSGKSTQFRLLTQRLEREAREFKRLVFPRYDQPSSALIRMYLGGEFGTHPQDVNAYAASVFFAVDRYAAFRQDWKSWYESGKIVLSDRYTTSNAVHQGSKLPPAQRKAFWEWLYDFEYARLGLPKPDLVLYLDVPTDCTQKLLRAREEATHTHADIHERDAAYLAACREAGRAAAEYYGWSVVACASGGAMRPIDDIHAEIYHTVLRCLEE